MSASVIHLFVISLVSVKSICITAVAIVASFVFQLQNLMNKWQLDVFLVRSKRFVTHPSSFVGLTLSLSYLVEFSVAMTQLPDKFTWTTNNLPTYFYTHFGAETLKVVREYERTAPISTVVLCLYGSIRKKQTNILNTSVE